MDKVIAVNIDKCLGCRSCEIACAVEHSQSKELESALAERPLPQRMVNVEPAGDCGVPLQCRHCEDAPCMTVCPTGAIDRESDRAPVLVNADRCIGCRFCIMVCPFGVLNISRDGKAVTKCDLCSDRTAAGKEPACVEACPTGALKFCDIRELTAQRRRAAAGKAGAGLTIPEKAEQTDED